MTRSHSLRITKREWYDLGGFKSTNCWRRQRGSCWAYYVVIDNLT